MIRIAMAKRIAIQTLTDKYSSTNCRALWKYVKQIFDIIVYKATDLLVLADIRHRDSLIQCVYAQYNAHKLQACTEKDSDFHIISSWMQRLKRIPFFHRNSSLLK